MTRQAQRHYSRTEPPLYVYTTPQPGLDELSRKTRAHRIAGKQLSKLGRLLDSSSIGYPDMFMETVTACGAAVDDLRCWNSGGRPFTHYIADPSLLGLALCRRCEDAVSRMHE